MSNKKPKKPHNKFLRFSSAGLQMGLTIYLGNFVGKWLDTKYQTTFLENTVTLLAVFIAIYSLIKVAINTSKNL